MNLSLFWRPERQALFSDLFLSFKGLNAVKVAVKCYRDSGTWHASKRLPRL